MTTAIEALKKNNPSVPKNIVAARVGDRLVDLSAPVDEAADISPVTLDAREGLDVLRHSAAHVMAQAVKGLFPEARPAIGPCIEDGFYYDFDVDRPFTPEDLDRIEKRMAEIVKDDLRIVRSELSRNDAIELFKGKGEVYKQELVEELADDRVSLYSQGDFVDLCRGPHLPSTGRIKAFKLVSSAGAYWRGDEKRKMLQRIYGTAFATKEDLEAHLKRLEEARKRDHRRIGRDLDLFSVSDEIGAGLVLWHPDGALVRHLIEDFWRKEHLRNSYDIVYTPHVALVDLWKTSGHWDFYRENLFSPMDVEGRDFIVKPMNCPFHIEIYRSRLRSYRDLPVRFAELGTVYRFERSGVLHGLLRVRGFTQDDAHIFMRPDQLKDEIQGVLKFTLYILRSFGFNDFDVFLSTRPDNYVGSLENWALAEGALKDALEASGLGFTIDPGEGVFYGPKIDIKIKDVLGRSWQCSTIQVDFNLPERFDVTYRDEGSNDARPIMIHRALMGSLERFMGCLVEHYAGAFPVWLAPRQAMILTVTDRALPYAKEVLARFKSEGLRVELDSRNEKLGLKIREAQLKKIPYMLVIGDKEASEGTLSVRSREKGDLGAFTPDGFVVALHGENKPMGGDFT